MTTKQLRKLLRYYGFEYVAKLPTNELLAWWNSDDSDVARDICSGG